jgi:hypothetical protein
MATRRRARETAIRLPPTRVSPLREAKVLNLPTQGSDVSLRREPVRIEPFQRIHLPAVVRLFASTWNAEGAAAFASRWTWTMEDNLAPSATRAWVALAGDLVVGVSWAQSPTGT